MSKTKLFTFVVFGLVAVLLLVSPSYNPLRTLPNVSIPRLPFTEEIRISCPDTLKNMLRGEWLPRKMTQIEEKEIRTFLEGVRTEWGLPKSLQRKDLLCGNSTFAKEPYTKSRWFRSLCTPDGATPCCMKNKCQDKTIEACQCEGCLDLRQTPNAEYSEWIPENKECKVHKFVGEESCKLLDGMTIYISGDSLMRHMFLAMLLILKNDFKRGFFKKDYQKNSVNCEGMRGFTEGGCRSYMSNGAVILCKGRVNITFAENYRVVLGPKFLHEVKDLINKPKSLVFAGIGYHDHFHVNAVKDRYLKPALDVTTHKKWPKILWSMPPAQGLLKHPTMMPQTLPKLLKFTKDMTKYLKQRNIEVFNSYALTDGMMSFDGIHHGLGINVQKVQIFLNYIQELRHKENW